MEGGLDTTANSHSGDETARLRQRDPTALAAFLRSWTGAVEGYCRTVCQAELAADAVEVTFADFLDKVDRHPIEDSHIESALMRSTRLTAAEAARIDWDEPGALERHKFDRFDCGVTPLFLAGSPSVRASVDALARMDRHVGACVRCQGSTARFEAAEAAFSRSKDSEVADDMLERLLRTFGISEDRLAKPDDTAPEPEEDSQGHEVFAPASLSKLDPDDLLGTTIDDFVIVAVHGENSDAVVCCRAADQDGREVTLRLVPRPGDRAFIDRFLADARLLEGLAHPSLPEVRAVGEAPEGAYIATEELQSRPLASVTEKGLPSRQVIRMLAQAAEAIDVSHAAGLLHRQVRPENVVVGAWLIVRPVVVNFALGRSHGVVYDDEQVPYLAPEELRGEGAGAAADRYAFACMVFEFLTGSAPFGTSKEKAVAGHLREEPPSAHVANAELPSGVDGVLRRALSKSPDERFGSAADLMSEVALAMSGPATSSPRPGAGSTAAMAGVTTPGKPPVSAAGRMAGLVAPARRIVRLRGRPPGGRGRDGSRPPKRLIAAGVAAALVVATALIALLAGGSSDDDSPTPPARSETAPARDTKTPNRARARPRSPARSAPALIRGAKATDYDPNGGNGENPGRVAAVTDGNVRTAWQTEPYPTGTFGRGVGVYLTLPKPETVKRIEIRTSSSGWNGEIYGASEGPPASFPAAGWTRLGSRSGMAGLERFPLRRGPRPLRHYLVWITKLPSEGVVSISEIRLFR